ncbi:histone-lysine N-methyltransferase SETMAR [Trichonephila clavipes]|nr:histone-lysine N-methyltransferase SETMAR [Trichonephila clavipes]
MIKDGKREQCNNILKRFITADEAWLYYYDPTIKQQISEWKHPSLPTLKKAKTVKSAGKVTTIIFYFEGIVYQHAVKLGATVNDSYYTNALRTMVQHVKRKHPSLRSGFLLHHGNAQLHVVHCVLDVSPHGNVEILLHPPYSPDQWRNVHPRNPRNAGEGQGSKGPKV